MPKIKARGNMVDSGDGTGRSGGAFMTCMDFILKDKGKLCRAFD